MKLSTVNGTQLRLCALRDGTHAARHGDLHHMYGQIQPIAPHSLGSRRVETSAVQGSVPVCSTSKWALTNSCSIGQSASSKGEPSSRWSGLRTKKRLSQARGAA